MEVGGGIGSPSYRIPSRWKSIASCMFALTSPIVATRDAGPHLSLHQRTENLASLPELLVGGRIADPEVCVALAEDVPRDDQHVVGDCLGHEVARRHPIRRFREDVERTVRADDL